MPFFGSAVKGYSIVEQRELDDDQETTVHDVLQGLKNNNVDKNLRSDHIKLNFHLHF